MRHAETLLRVVLLTVIFAIRSTDYASADPPPTSCGAPNWTTESCHCHEDGDEWRRERWLCEIGAHTWAHHYPDAMYDSSDECETASEPSSCNL
jgi:hypothetical protein